MILAKDKVPQKDYDKKTRYPKHRITLYLMLFYEAFWRIIGANLLFILFCIPIVTIPAAIGGLTRVMSRFARDEQAYVIDDFMKGFKQEWKKNTAFAAIQLAFIALAYVAIGVYSKLIDNSTFSAILVALVLAVAIMFFAISNYVYVMIASVDLSLKQIIRNALALYLIKPFGTLITMIVQAVIIFVAIGYFPVGLFLPIVFGFSIMSFTASFNSWPQIEKYVITPHNKTKEGDL